LVRFASLRLSELCTSTIPHQLFGERQPERSEAHTEASNEREAAKERSRSN